jgi:hypothetical protein
MCETKSVWSDIKKIENVLPIPVIRKSTTSWLGKPVGVM